MGIATMKNYWSRVRGVFLAALLGCVLLGGCATQTRSVPTNSPIISATPHQMGMRSDFVGKMQSFSLFQEEVFGPQPFR